MLIGRLYTVDGEYVDYTNSRQKKRRKVDPSTIKHIEELCVQDPQIEEGTDSSDDLDEGIGIWTE